MRTARTQKASSQPAFDEARQELNNLITDFNNAFLNRLHTSAAIAIGTTVQKIKSAANNVFSVSGDIKAKNATDDEWTLGAAGANTNVAVAAFQKYVLYRDAAGAATVAEGVQAATAAGVTLPQVPAAKSIIGVVTVQNGSAGNFVPGTTALNAAGLTVTYVNGLDTAQLYAAQVTL